MTLITSMQILVIPLAALLITQLIKIIIDLTTHKVEDITLDELASYGGMPSSHSALFASLVTASYLLYGAGSFEFAVSIIMYFVIIRDAMGIRWHLGEHGAILKQLIEEQAKDHDHVIPHRKIKTRLGHTPFQVLMGTICGIVISVGLYWVIN